MKSGLRLAIGLSVTLCTVAIASIRWLDPEPAVYEAATSVLTQDAPTITVASSPSTCGATDANLEGVSSNLVAAFRTANAPGVSFGNVATLLSRFGVADSAQLAALDAAGIAPPRPVLRISRVGFSPDNTEALLCLRGIYGSMLVHLKKISGAWRVVHKVDREVAATAT